MFIINLNMNKRYVFYTFKHSVQIKETWLYQGCIKSCIKQKSQPHPNPWKTRVLFFRVFRKECLCKLEMYEIYIAKNQKIALPIQTG